MFGELMRAVDSSKYKDSTTVALWADHGPLSLPFGAFVGAYGLSSVPNLKGTTPGTTAWWRSGPRGWRPALPLPYSRDAAIIRPCSAIMTAVIPCPYSRNTTQLHVACIWHIGVTAWYACILLEATFHSLAPLRLAFGSVLGEVVFDEAVFANTDAVEGVGAGMLDAHMRAEIRRPKTGWRGENQKP